jgi:hypothetical protein
MEQLATNPLIENILQVPSLAVFDGSSYYIQLMRIYFALHKKIPSLKIIKKIEMDKFMAWFENQGEYTIKTSFIKERWDWEDKKMEMTNSIYLLENEIMVDLDDDVVALAFAAPQKIAAQSFIDLAKQYKIRKKNAHEIKMVISCSGSMDTSTIKLSKPKMNVHDYYNDDLFPKHKQMLHTLNKKDKAGLILFYGEPGTGKSTYIRYLIHYIRKDVIFMSPSMASNLDTPEVTRLLIENPNTVFVIEDAEKLLVSREKEKNSSISMLLNLTDGLLGDSLGIQFIATFNTHIQNIDKALLRKGRLNSLYEFKPLTIEKSKNLLEKNGITNYLVNKPMTLAELFNISQDDFEYKTEGQGIGFFSKTG